jgi:hypothetical protein
LFSPPLLPAALTDVLHAEDYTLTGRTSDLPASEGIYVLPSQRQPGT